MQTQFQPNKVPVQQISQGLTYPNIQNEQLMTAKLVLANVKKFSY